MILIWISVIAESCENIIFSFFLNAPRTELFLTHNNVETDTILV